MASRSKRRTPPTELKASLSLTAGGANFLSARRMQLLEALATTGSIAAAARAAHLTYKAAWDNISAINNLAEKPVVTRQKGGRGGGGSQLTEFGRELIGLYRQVAAAQDVTAARLQVARQPAPSSLSTLRVIALRTSARNQYLGRVRAIRHGAVSSEVALDLGDGLSITSIITRQSVSDLGLAVGGTAVALIKASFILLANQSPLRVSARNVLTGTIARIQRGSVNGEVHLDLPGHRSLVATLTLESIRDLGLRKGAVCQAVIKASHVLLAVTD